MKSRKVLVGESFSYTVFTQKGEFHGTHGTPSGSAYAQTAERDNPWIRTTRGLPSANRGSTLRATIHGLSGQCMDPRFAQHRVRHHKQRREEAIAERDCMRPAAQGDVRDSF